MIGCRIIDNVVYCNSEFASYYGDTCQNCTGSPTNPNPPFSDGGPVAPYECYCNNNQGEYVYTTIDLSKFFTLRLRCRKINRSDRYMSWQYKWEYLLLLSWEWRGENSEGAGTRWIFKVQWLVTEVLIANSMPTTLYRKNGGRGLSWGSLDFRSTRTIFA